MLIVDDNVTMRLLLCNQLDKLGFYAECAATGLEALACIKATAHRVIFMDVHMPDMNGYDATRAIRAHEAALGLPRSLIVALTCDSNSDKCYEAGMDAYLQKPVTSEQLRMVLQTWLNIEQHTRLAI